MGARPSALFLKRLLGSLIVISAVFALCRPIRGIDTWLYLAGGEYIAKFRTIPKADVFSWTVHGKSWMNHEWLFELLFYSFYRFGRIPGLIFLKSLFVLAAFYFLDLRLRQRSVAWPWRIALLGVSFVACRGFWVERADLVTLAMVSALLYTWERRQILNKLKPALPLGGLRALNDGMGSTAFWLWPGLFVLWANMHGGFLIGLTLLAILAVGALLDGNLDIRGTAKWVSACAFATCLNPFGPFLHISLIGSTLALKQGFVREWQAQSLARHPLFWFSLILAGFTLCLPEFRRKRWSFQSLLALLFFAYLGIRHQRFVPLFMVCALPYALMQIVESHWGEKMSSWLQRNERLLLRGCVVAALLAAAAFARGIQGGIDRSATYFADGAFDFIASERIQGPFYNDYPFGSSWLWRFKGSPPVFIDGRISIVDGYDSLVNQIAEAQRSPKDWEAFLTRYGAAAALVRYPFPSHADVPSMFRAFFPRNHWALVYWDDLSLLFLRRDPANKSVIQQWEFRAIDPDVTLERFRSQWIEKRTDRRGLKRDLLRNRELHPDSWRTGRFLDLIAEISEK